MKQRLMIVLMLLLISFPAQAADELEKIANLTFADVADSVWKGTYDCMADNTRHQGKLRIKFPSSEDSKVAVVGKHEYSYAFKKDHIEMSYLTGFRDYFREYTLFKKSDGRFVMKGGLRIKRTGQSDVLCDDYLEKRTVRKKHEDELTMPDSQPAGK